MRRLLTLALAFGLSLGAFQALAAPAPPIAAPTAEPKTVTVYVTKSGKKYHEAGCRYLAKSCIPMALAEARKHYEPCSVCKPPR